MANGSRVEVSTFLSWGKCGIIGHCSELAVKDAFKNSKFKKIEDFYHANFNLLKASGKIKSEVTNAATTLSIQAHTLPKLKGTRFVEHRLMDEESEEETESENI